MRSLILIRLWRHLIDLLYLLNALRSENSYKTIVFHEFAPDLVNVHFPTQDQSFWNNLPVYIRAEPDIMRFKNILKTYFLDSHLTY